jgi:hypothetical protein
MLTTSRNAHLAPALALLLAVLPAAASAQQSAAEQLANARRLFDALNYEQAAVALDQFIAAAPASPIRDRDVIAAMTIAYELRGRSRFFLGDSDGARADFRALLRLAPGHQLSQVSARVKAVFDDVAKTSVGRIVLNLAPPDAELELDGVPFEAVAGAIPVAAGKRTITARRAGCRPLAQEIVVTAGATQEVALTLERVTATLQFVTVPPGVDVVVDGAARGRTAAGPLSPAFAEAPAALGLPPESFSRPFVLDDLPQGEHVVQFQRACHIPVERRVAIERLDDYRLDPVALQKAVASIYVDTPAAGVTVLLDGEARGPAPLSLDDVCEGSHVVELRSPWGRYVERLSARTGDKITVQGIVRPAIALLAVNGLPEGYRGPDARLGIEAALVGSRTVTIFAPPIDKVRQALNAESLSPGWLAFDRSRRPLTPGASAITNAARLDLAKRLSAALEVQGVAEATLRPGGNRNQYLLTILSSDSALPDVVEVTLENPGSINAAVVRLDAVPGFYRPSVGLVAADVLDVGAPVVIAADAAALRAGIAVGDVIEKLDGQPVADASAFVAGLGARKANDKLAVEVKDRSGALKRAELTVAMAPRLLAMSDETWTFNTLVLGLRSRLVGGGGQAEDPVVRLHLAVALMRVGNWAEARAQLGRLRLPAGAGVSNGTVQYLLGLCHEALGQPSEAERSWRAAAADAESLLTEDGPPVKELSERKLAALAAIRR